ncbi:unnamed protein product [Gongylonema pulchrum]|uniref:Transposase n=1 Tax=Gongylonema pulchrum TaxID=637853 RepID=A0A183DHX3_9BILA|nr:unnamed protein product [Gongylonema pulchrum]
MSVKYPGKGSPAQKVKEKREALLKSTLRCVDLDEFLAAR